jgi:hypothetical protein
MPKIPLSPPLKKGENILTMSKLSRRSGSYPRIKYGASYERQDNNYYSQILNQTALVR